MVNGFAHIERRTSSFGIFSVQMYDMMKKQDLTIVRNKQTNKQNNNKKKKTKQSENNS
jgi:hypothetical protein